MKLPSRNIRLVIALIVIIAAIVLILLNRTIQGDFTVQEIPFTDVTMTAEEKAEIYPLAKELTTPDAFINTKSINIMDQIGKKVVMVDFWTYSCINCQRTIPQHNAWYKKYESQGLEIIGIHTPEFKFEESLENVQIAVKNLGVNYPVVLDNDYSTWQAYGNRYWPHIYLIDIDGFIVYDHIGEGNYEETEREIQKLLRERSIAVESEKSVSTNLISLEDTDTSQASTPEIYFGASRNTYLVNGVQQVTGIQSLELPEEPKKNRLYLQGYWLIEDEFAQNTTFNASILVNYNSQDVYIVADAVRPLDMTVLLDGEPVGIYAGEHIEKKSGKSIVEIKEPGLYHLIHDSTGPGLHTLELFVDKPGLQAFTFTFG